MSNVNERMIERIDATMPNIPSDSEDRRVLTYIRSQLVPSRLKWREEHDVGGEGHLLDVAKQRLRPYATTEEVTTS